MTALTQAAIAQVAAAADEIKRAEEGKAGKPVIYSHEWEHAVYEGRKLPDDHRYNNSKCGYIHDFASGHSSLACTLLPCMLVSNPKQPCQKHSGIVPCNQLIQLNPNNFMLSSQSSSIAQGVKL